MKEQIKQIIQQASTPLQARNLLREYLQARLLEFIQERGLFRSWIFQGGTALRFLYGLPRYSQDLDFSLDQSDASYDLNQAIAGIRPWFEAEAYEVDLIIKNEKNVKSAFVRFPSLLFELGLSPHRSQVFSVKIELDSQPPAGGRTETTIIRRPVLLNIHHYDQATLFSGKVHALLSRNYTKGRDLYDIFWYLSDPSWPAPNFIYLNEALKQTGWSGPQLDQNNWADLVAEKLEAVDWRQAIEDVRPFLERVSDLNLLTKDNVLKLLATRSREARKHG